MCLNLLTTMFFKAGYLGWWQLVNGNFLLQNSPVQISLQALVLSYDCEVSRIVNSFLSYNEHVSGDLFIGLPSQLG